MLFPLQQDTAGQERFHALGPIYYREADGTVSSFSCSNPLLHRCFQKAFVRGTTMYAFSTHVQVLAWCTTSLTLTPLPRFVCIELASVFFGYENYRSTHLGRDAVCVYSILSPPPFEWMSYLWFLFCSSCCFGVEFLSSVTRGLSTVTEELPYRRFYPFLCSVVSEWWGIRCAPVSPCVLATIPPFPTSQSYVIFCQT